MNAHRPEYGKPEVAIVLQNGEELQLLRFALDLVHQQLYDGANQSMEAAHYTAVAGNMIEQLAQV